MYSWQLILSEKLADIELDKMIKTKNEYYVNRVKQKFHQLHFSDKEMMLESSRNVDMHSQQPNRWTIQKILCTNQTQGSQEFIKIILVPRHRHQQFDNLVLGTFSSSNEKLVSAKLWTTREINTGHTLDNFVAITCLT